ncbi:MAG TPA: alpha-glucan family phosphorylase [Verrucomicrobiae bacterium]|nr:alpha-glucan family phosphorylase [Verrucomicrobiae bacterium]
MLEQTENLTAESVLPALTELALDLRWSWNHSTDGLWRRLDPHLWESTHNPWVVLQTVSRQVIEEACASPNFRQDVERMLQRKRDTDSASAWFQTTHPNAGLTCAAYFSMEFMLSEALPIYSGGLGNVAGDQLKAASDLGVPVIGIGLLYQQGYFRQEIDRDGYQQALYPFNDPGQLPIEPLRDANGEWLRIPMQFPEATLWVRTWQAHIGRTRLYLLDTNDPANLPTHRGIASELYGGGPELRLQQEMILAMAGWRLLSALGIHPEVCHLNEGHAALAVLERAFSYMQDQDQPFEVALTVTRAGNLFTTHTPVEAGFDRFPPELMRQYLRRYAENELRIDFDDLLALGRKNPLDVSEPFNMAYLAIHGSGAVNGVSQLHGKVSRRIFQPLFPRWPEAEVPVGHVTNGVHVPTWDSAEADQLWTETCGEERWRGTLQTTELVQNSSDEKIWDFRMKASESLVAYTRARLSRQLTHRGATADEIAMAGSIFDPYALTIGFARRFATYKRPNLLLYDPVRLIRILTNRKHPVQLILAGKAHPQDREGQAMIKQWMDSIVRPEVRRHVAFLSDYDLQLTSHLVQGVDLWLNTPRRPWEASGTSGMKVLVNGGLNLSELDGWWAEAYSPEVGWALGDGREHDDDPRWDAHEAEALYDILENEVIPAFYTRDDRGVPTAWVAKMRASMVRLTARFSSNRAVRQYVESYYLPAAAVYRERADQGSRRAIEILNWSRSLTRNWASLRFGEVSSRPENDQLVFEAQVSLNELTPDAVDIELYAESLENGCPFRQTMVRQANRVGPFTIYTARVPANRPSSDYTARIIPREPGVAVPLEAPQILWHAEEMLD